MSLVSTLAKAKSKSSKSIRLTAERWFHIIESHDYMAGYFYDILETISDPDYVVAGKRHDLLAAKFYRKTRTLARSSSLLFTRKGIKRGL